MSKNSKVGNAYYYSQKSMDRLIKEIDRREQTGKNRENVDNIFNSYTTADNGERTWSF